MVGFHFSNLFEVLRKKLNPFTNDTPQELWLRAPMPAGMRLQNPATMKPQNGWVSLGAHERQPIRGFGKPIKVQGGVRESSNMMLAAARQGSHGDVFPSKEKPWPAQGCTPLTDNARSVLFSRFKLAMKKTQVTIRKEKSSGSKDSIRDSTAASQVELPHVVEEAIAVARQLTNGVRLDQ
jgi:hypothetical protein